MSIWRCCPTRTSTVCSAPTPQRAKSPIRNELRGSQPSRHRIRRQTGTLETTTGERTDPSPSADFSAARSVGDVAGGGGGFGKPYLRLPGNEGADHFQGSRDGHPAGG